MSVSYTHLEKVIEAETVIISTGATAKYLGLEDEQKYAGMADWETEKAAEVFQAMWMRYPDLKAVYCSNDAMAWGVLQQMREKNCYLPIVGFDNDAVMKEFLSTGKLVATADIFSSQMAVRGIEFALDVLEGKRCV